MNRRFSFAGAVKHLPMLVSVLLLVLVFAALFPLHSSSVWYYIVKNLTIEQSQTFNKIASGPAIFTVQLVPAVLIGVWLLGYATGRTRR